MVLGIDGCQEGWVGIALDDQGCYKGIATAPILHELLRSFPDFTVAGVDMPLHLTNTATRPADIAARKLLGAQRGRSVFPAPPKFVISPKWINRDPGEVSNESRRRHSCGIPRQSLALRAKIQEINQAFNDGLPVIEVHPELSFAIMNLGRPLSFRKKSWGGMRERLALLQDTGIHLPDTLPDAVARLASDDIIDAAAAAWSAHRHTHRKATPLPNAPATPRSPVIWA
jgi:predicted RNase H-like nuclease